MVLILFETVPLSQKEPNGSSNQTFIPAALWEPLLLLWEPLSNVYRDVLKVAVWGEPVGRSHERRRGASALQHRGVHGKGLRLGVRTTGNNTQTRRVWDCRFGLRRNGQGWLIGGSMGRHIMAYYDSPIIRVWDRHIRFSMPDSPSLGQRPNPSDTTCHLARCPLVSICTGIEASGVADHICGRPRRPSAADAPSVRGRRTTSVGFRPFRGVRPCLDAKKHTQLHGNYLLTLSTSVKEVLSSSETCIV